jgi:hypothetical protein
LTFLTSIFVTAVEVIAEVIAEGHWFSLMAVCKYRSIMDKEMLKE